MRPLSVIKALLAVIFWGASFIATKIALRDVQPIVVITLRFALGVVVLFIALRLRHLRVMIDRRDWRILIMLAFNGIWLHQMLQATGLAQGASATNTGWYVAITPIFTALLAAIFLRETIGPIKIAGIVVATLGVLLVVSKGDLGGVIAHGLPVTLGDLLTKFAARGGVAPSTEALYRGLRRRLKSLLGRRVSALHRRDIADAISACGP